MGSEQGFSNRIQRSRMPLKIYFPVSKPLMMQLIADVRNSPSHRRMGGAQIVSKEGQAIFQGGGEPE
jgi:hypothetical protein